tara:strand:+ start:11801 stop:12106 length:306 start_codon:yes stop_codon:yes gene_type:complete
MRTISDEVRRMKEIMGISEDIQNNNFAQMGIDRKVISRGGVMHQEQEEDVIDVEINKEKEDLTRQSINIQKKKQELDQRRRDQLKIKEKKKEIDKLEDSIR